MHAIPRPRRAAAVHVGDAAITAGAATAAAYLALRGRWVHDFWFAFVTFALIAVGAPALRALALRFPRQRWLDLAASLWLTPAVIFGHFAMGPLVDAAHPKLFDGALAALDLRVFHAHPSVVLGQWVHGPVLDALMLCYYSYFVVPFALALWLYATDGPRFEELVAALALVFTLNFLGYVLVPAVGPRYFLFHAFAQPLRGGAITAFLDSWMRQPVFAADCFPSGHTAVMLTSLVCAWRSRRWLFFAVLPVALGLLAATLVGRFHYGVDLIAAIPLACASMALAWPAVHAQGRRAAAPAWLSRAPAKA